MKITFLLFTAFLLINVCSNKHFTILSATSESWVAGAKTGGSGVDYTFKIVVKTSKGLKFDSMWVDNKAIKVQAVKGTVYDPKSVFVLNDTIKLKATYKVEANPSTQKPPIEYKGAALIRYFVGGKKNYQVVEKLEAIKGRPRS